jgi:hypothetical protein
LTVFQKRELVGRIRVNIAGRVAEGIYREEMPDGILDGFYCELDDVLDGDNSDGSDEAKVLRVLGALGMDDIHARRTERFLLRQIEDTWSFLTEHWDHVDRVAKAVLKRGAIRGRPAIDRLCLGMPWFGPPVQWLSTLRRASAKAKVGW